MNFYALTGLINAVVASFFGLLIFFKNPKRITNKTFGLFCLSTAVWSYSYFFWQISNTEEAALFWSRMLMNGAIFITIFYFHFILGLINQIQEKKKILITGYLLFLSFFLINFTPFFVEGVKPKFNFDFWPNPGIFYHPFLVLWFFYAFYSIYLLFKKYLIFSGTAKNQLRYILLGTIVGYLGGATNYFLWYDIPVPPVGNWTATFYLGMVAYAIIRYRLMDIRFVLGRGAVYFLSFATVIALASGLMYLNEKLPQPISFNIAGALIVIISILLFQFVFRIFEKFTSKYFYYTFYSSQIVLRDLGRKLTQFLELDKLSSLIVTTLMNTMKLDRTIILLKEPKDGDYIIQKNIGFKEENGISLVKDNFLTTWLEKNQKPLVYEEISLIVRDTQNKGEKTRLEILKDNMKRIEAALCLPLLIEDKIFGMVVLGSKISGEPYSEQDINLLNTLSNQASIALQNAKSYDQVQDLSQNLQEKVDEQTGELKKAYEELKELDVAKSEFISMASHQLRTPLTAIKGYISMILEGTYGKLPDSALKPLNNILTSGERLIRIVNDLLDISKIELGKIELNMAACQLEDLIQSCYEELKEKAKENNLKFIWQKPKIALPQIRIDELKIRQVITNLIDNAIRYTKKGEIEIKAEKKDSKIQISIRDTGEGLSGEEEKKIFESFTRGSAGINLFVEGAGLGLYVARKFVELHNGKVWAESKGKGKGSTFYIELPIKS